MSVSERLHRVLDELALAARAAGRDPSEVRLVAVSKRQPVGAIREAYAAGQRDFGENYAQELRDKASALADLPDLRWHFIGRLQTNKARYVAPVAHRVHAVSNLAQGEALAKRREADPLGVLVAVNLGGEASKGGVEPDEVLTLARELREVPGLAVEGLMTLPPWSEDPEASRPWFSQLAALAAEGRAQGLGLTELSMGTTQDYRVAVEEGATWVRVGTAIFGARES